MQKEILLHFLLALFFVSALNSHYAFADGAPVPMALELTFTSDDPTCAISNNGYVMTTAMGGVEPYTYLWSTGNTTQYITGLGAGTYSVTVTDANGETAVGEVTLVESGLSVYFFVTADACAGQCNGHLVFAVSGDSGKFPDYSLSLDDGAIEAGGFCAGTYIATVTDDNGCTATNSYTLGEVPSPETAVVDIQDATCGQANGSIHLATTGGTGEVVYTWAGGESSNPLINNLMPGLYSITVSDASDCSTVVTATVGGNAAIQMTVLSSPSCDNLATGVLNVDAISGGTPFYTYNWSNGGVGNPLENVAAGTYTVTATDSEGCTATSSVTVEEIICVGINDPSAIEVFSIYPNPTKGAINLNLSPEWVNKATVVQLYNTLGQKVWEQAVSPSMVMRTETLPVGTYLLSIQLKNGKQVSQLVVIRD